MNQTKNKIPIHQEQIPNATVCPPEFNISSDGNINARSLTPHHTTPLWLLAKNSLLVHFMHLRSEAPTNQLLPFFFLSHARQSNEVALPLSLSLPLSSWARLTLALRFRSTLLQRCREIGVSG